MKHVRLTSYWNDFLFPPIFRRHPGFPGYSPPGYMPRYRRNLSPTPGYLSGNVHRHRNKSGGVGGLLPSYWYPRWAPTETGSRGSTRRGWETASEGTGDRGWETDPGEHGGTSGKRRGRGGAGKKERRRRRNSTGSYPGSTSSGGGRRDAPRQWHWRISAGDDTDSESGVSPIGRGQGLPADSRHTRQQPHYQNQTETSVPFPTRTRHPQQQTPHHDDRTETSVPKAYNRNWGNVLPRLN